MMLAYDSHGRKRAVLLQSILDAFKVEFRPNYSLYDVTDMYWRLSADDRSVLCSVSKDAMDHAADADEYCVEIKDKQAQVFRQSPYCLIVTENGYRPNWLIFRLETELK